MAETERDEEVTRAYRALGSEEPPRALDEAILARARRRTPRWGVPLSIAAVLVLAVGVVLRVQHERPGAESVALAPQVIETPRPTAKPAEPPARLAQSAPSPAAPAAAEVHRQAPAPAAMERARRADELAAAGALRSAGKATAPVAESAANAERREAPAAGVTDLRGLAAAPLTPEAWLERIAEMRKQGRTREAEESLAEFRKRYPDYKIPEALR